MKEIKVINLELQEDQYQEMKDETEKLGIPVAGFLRLLLHSYFSGVTFKRGDKKNGDKIEAGVIEGTAQNEGADRKSA